MQYRLKECRQKAGLTQEQVANEIGSAQYQIYKYETGKQDITLEKAIRLAYLYNVSLDYLAGISDEEKPLF